ncbi:PREDICTED: serine--tRNA ligase, mitochondrial [Nicrophorus vespilloides]|uniref:serine--tRNA ligase n=1 Tax=Nicrophorus vespilloides TaxID=110193 RepID=A0ABM1MM71_NICVS|nr:PREDICTED: serine--tRNA ligase, mitochondrial [Nicrophorus vespilloides]
MFKFIRKLSTQNQRSVKLSEFPDLNVEYLCNPKNLQSIAENINRRKGIGNVALVNELKQKLESSKPDTEEYLELKRSFYKELLQIPNFSHPAVINYGEDPVEVKRTGEERKFEFKPRQFHEITKRLNLARTEHLGNVSGTKSYYFLGELAELEQALIQYTLCNLVRNQFKLMSVPDLLDRRIIESCGMSTTGERTQVYNLSEEHKSDLCLSGTSEMALAGFFANKTFDLNELPLKVATVSRCFRAETSSLAEESGIYRVHNFTKVEMFAVASPSQSELLLDDFKSIEEEHFSSLGLCTRTLDMPPHELGAPAFRKYDVEAWMPGRGMFGEISSCSNCTDFQARRLGIRSGEGFLHTLNGTACAIPRMMIALIETYQNDNGTVSVPEKLWPFMRGKKKIGRQKQIPELKLIKNKK